MAWYGALLSVGAPAGLWLWLRVLRPAPDDLLLHVFLYCSIATCLVFVLFGGFAGNLLDKLYRDSTRDALTGLYSRRHFMEVMPRVQAGCARRQQPLCVLMLDLDHFKRVNDRFGHPTGDQTLRTVAMVLLKTARMADLVCRYGGEEFVVLCPDTDADAGFGVAERIRRAIAAVPNEVLGYRGPTTVSIGVACTAPGGTDETDKLVARADASLYEAKRRGRNRTCAADPGALAAVRAQ